MKTLKQGDKIYYLHPVMGITSEGSVYDWHVSICEIREGVYIETNMNVYSYKIMPKGKPYSMDIEKDFVFNKKAHASEMLGKHNKLVWKNIASRFMDMEKDISDLRESIKKIKNI